MWQVAGDGRDGRDDRAGAQRRLRQLCEPSSTWTSPVQTSLCILSIPPTQVLNLVGLVQDLGEEGCREARRQQSSSKPCEGGPICPPQALLAPSDLLTPPGLQAGCRAPQSGSSHGPQPLGLARQGGGQVAVGIPGAGASPGDDDDDDDVSDNTVFTW